ncbi:MAG: DotU family type IV/VI secretion system protein [Pirellula sp.]|jgi:type VI secretion system protein ImpK
MGTQLSRVVDPIFAIGISLLERIERNISFDYEREHAAILEQFARGDSLAGEDGAWRLARYALAVWIDEICLSLPWNGSEWWQSNILEMEIFQSRICNVRFFELAKQAASYRDRQALDVFYCCVVLGFRGMYASSECLPNQSSVGEFPATLQNWLEWASRLLNANTTPSYQLGPNRIVAGAPPLSGRRQQVVWTAAAAMLFALNVALASLVWSR